MNGWYVGILILQPSCQDLGVFERMRNLRPDAGRGGGDPRENADSDVFVTRGTLMPPAAFTGMTLGLRA